MTAEEIRKSADRVGGASRFNRGADFEVQKAGVQALAEVAAQLAEIKIELHEIQYQLSQRG